MVASTVANGPSSPWDAISLIITLRIWRVKRIIDAYVLPVKVEMEMMIQQYEKAKVIQDEQLERLTQICQEQGFEIRQLRAHLAQQDLDLAAEREAALQVPHVLNKQSSKRYKVVATEDSDDEATESITELQPAREDDMNNYISRYYNEPSSAGIQWDPAGWRGGLPTPPAIQQGQGEGPGPVSRHSPAQTPAGDQGIKSSPGQGPGACLPHSCELLLQSCPSSGLTGAGAGSAGHGAGADQQDRTSSRIRISRTRRGAGGGSAGQDVEQEQNQQDRTWSRSRSAGQDVEQEQDQQDRMWSRSRISRTGCGAGAAGQDMEQDQDQQDRMWSRSSRTGHGAGAGSAGQDVEQDQQDRTWSRSSRTGRGAGSAGQDVEQEQQDRTWSRIRISRTGRGAGAGAAGQDVEQEQEQQDRTWSRSSRTGHGAGAGAAGQDVEQEQQDRTWSRSSRTGRGAAAASPEEAPELPGLELLSPWARLGALRDEALAQPWLPLAPWQCPRPGWTGLSTVGWWKVSLPWQGWHWMGWQVPPSPNHRVTLVYRICALYSFYSGVPEAAICVVTTAAIDVHRPNISSELFTVEVPLRLGSTGTSASLTSGSASRSTVSSGTRGCSESSQTLGSSPDCSAACEEPAQAGGARQRAAHAVVQELLSSLSEEARLAQKGLDPVNLKLPSPAGSVGASPDLGHRLSVYSRRNQESLDVFQLKPLLDCPQGTPTIEEKYGALGPPEPRLGRVPEA
ncbi:hypothetical protein DUI87_29406 [Hirundo rustica rustica]|uniref:Transmembrane protein 266 n=1 Tax=Hirundo rustica rustica TaxID=333673 RepID=A0A3M0J1I8_HIRRU|nr:hypothetical protein DUI87_29406 [Hirundo rustica rustica]